MLSWLALLLGVALSLPFTSATSSGGPALARVHRAASPAHVASPPRGSTLAALHGGDISWPNCRKGEGIPKRRGQGEPMPRRSAEFVIVGVTNGPGFHPNPCLARELRWVDRHQVRLGAYAMTTYPRPAERRRYRDSGPYDASAAHGGLRNAGYAEARFNLRTMARLGMQVPMIWVDVEPYPTFPWTHNHRANRAVVTGAIRAYRKAGLRVGIYTYANGWRQVVGGWQPARYPTWSTIGDGSAHRALAACSRGPSGGVTWLVQWWVPHRDLDLVCPAADARTQAVFH